MGLLEIREELVAARDFIECVYIACQSVQEHSEQAALCAVSYAAREKLKAVDAAIGALISGAI